MSRLRSFVFMVAWFSAVTGLYLLETYNWPEAANWRMLSWQPWVLGSLNAMVVGATVAWWKELRKGGQ